MKMNRSKMKRMQKEQKKFEQRAAAIETEPVKTNKLWLLSYLFAPLAFPTWVIYSLWLKFVYRGSGINRTVSLTSMVTPDILRFHFAAVLQGFFTWYFFYDIIPFRKITPYITLLFNYLIWNN